MPTVTLSSNNFNNESSVITLDAIDSNTYSLGTQILPYDYTSNMVYGVYTLFFPTSGITCKIVIPPVCDLKYEIVVTTPPPTPSPTSVPIFGRTIRNDSNFENFYQIDVFDSFSGPIQINLSSFNTPTRVVVIQDGKFLIDSGYYGDENLYGINGTLRSTYVENSLNGKLDLVTSYFYPNNLTSESETDGYPFIKNFTTINELFVKQQGGPLYIYIYSIGYITNDNNYDLNINLF